MTGVILADVAILESYLELLFATSGGFGIVKMCWTFAYGLETVPLNDGCLSSLPQ